MSTNLALGDLYVLGAVVEEEAAMALAVGDASRLHRGEESRARVLRRELAHFTVDYAAAHRFFFKKNFFKTHDLRGI